MQGDWRRSLPASPEQARQARRRILVLESAGLSRRQIAQRSGLSAATITRLARGQLHLTRTTARALLGVRLGHHD